jgi:hypothetical protein
MGWAWHGVLVDLAQGQDVGLGMGFSVGEGSISLRVKACWAWDGVLVK